MAGKVVTLFGGRWFEMLRMTWDPVHPIMLQDPDSVYRELRAHCPVARTDYLGGMWGIFRYDNIVKAARDTATFANGARPRYPHMRRIPLETDPPEHTSYRRLVLPFFSAERMNRLEPAVRSIAAELIEPLIGRGRVDIAQSLTYPLPVRAVCAWLNLPDEDWDKILYWSEELFASSWGKDPERSKAAETALAEYCRQKVDERRRSPHPPGTDVIADLLAARIDGKPLEEILIIGALHLMLTAGHDSTTSSIGIIIKYLADHPDVENLLRSRPELIPNAAEEILRLETPVQMSRRTVTRDTEFGGQMLTKGDRVFLVWGSGNRDESVFGQPDKFDPARSPNLHLTFGFGVHKCVGAPLARLEIRVAIGELLQRTSRIEPAGPAVRTGNPRFGISSLPVILHP